MSHRCDDGEMLREAKSGPTIAVAILALVVGVGCVPGATALDGSVSQIPPIAANGMAWDGGEIWLADLFGGQLLRFDPQTGVVSRRFGPESGLTAPDDLVVFDDGTLVYTSPTAGVVGRIRPGGAPETLAVVGDGVNPIVKDPAGGAVIVGEAFNDNSRIVRISLATGAQTVLATGLPAINSFSIGSDGWLYAPSGGVSSAVSGSGGVVRVNLATGASEPLALSFPGEPGAVGFRFPVAAKFGPDGALYVLQGFEAGVYRVDVATGVSTRWANMPTPWADNLLWVGPRLFASTFFGQVVEFVPGGAVTLAIGRL